MNSKPSIFKPCDPLVEAGSLFTDEPDSDGGAALSLRPVWIIGDLKMLHRWLDSSERKTNWILDGARETLYQRYKNLLLSDRAQSLMVTENNSPLVQFDLLAIPAATKEHIHARLYFIFEENFRDPHRFARSLRLLLQYLFSFPDMKEVRLQLSNPDSALSAVLEKLAFGPVDTDPFQPGQAINFRVTRLPAIRRTP